MKAIVQDRYGSPDVLRLKEVSKPAVAHDDVLVRVRAASLNADDLDYLYGRAFARLGTGLRGPRNRVLGTDVAGLVEAVGRSVTRFRPGDEVYGDLSQWGQGAFAEYVSAPARAFAHKPNGMSFENAATLPHSAVIALQSLRNRRAVRPGEKVLINGASGSVGSFAVQIAKALGAEVTGVCSTSKMDLVRSIGADHVIDYTRENLTRNGQRYDRIVDVVGRRSILDWRRALKPGGVYVMVGGSTSRFLQALFLGTLISLTGSTKMGLLWWRPFKKEDVAVVEGLTESGKVAPVIDRRYPLSEVPDALRYLDQGHARGKVVITL